jgi:fatty acid-binding protein DegV
MARVGIVTDSTTCIPESVIRELDILTVPYYIHRGSEVLRDLVTIDRDTFYKWLPTATQLPTTASPGPGDYISAYEELANHQNMEEIVSLHMTSKGSGAYQAAVAAKSMIMETLPRLKIEVIDTLNVSMCHGWMAIEAARAALANMRLSEVIDRVKQMIPITHMIQTADTLKYLYMGGRIGMEDGEITALGTARSRKQAYKTMVDMVEKAIGENGKIKIAYMHAAALEEAYKIKEMVEERIEVVEWMICELSPALGVHTGPGTAGLCYFPVTD